MEKKNRIIHNEQQLLDHFLQKSIESIFDIPTQGRNTYDTNKVTLENELDKYTTSKITTIDKNNLFSEMNKIIARIQDFSVVGKQKNDSLYIDLYFRSK